ncbi:sugar ABC transporter substrate-binding protein [Neobacillus drentensis]|uniref:sugar ABC transporter substrate-binding protein n=1 Tax=Neobacillus drentensis TaxID=220684 RepID=UPI002FFDC470
MKLKLIPFMLVIALVLYGCSSAPSGNSSESGSGSKQKRIAYFSAGATNNYLQTGIDHAEKTAKELGMNIDVFDGRFDPLAQLNQVQNAITSGKYDGFVIEAVDGNQLCKIATKDATAKGIAVAAINIELCGATDTAAEGTLTFVGGQGVEVTQNILKKIFNDKPEGGKIVAIGGPATGTPYLNMKKAFDIEMPKNPKWKLIGMHSTDYTANQAFQVAQNILQANPDIDVIYSNYSGMTVGVVKAKKAASNKDVKIYDFGGDKWAFDAIKKGDIQQTIIMLPKEEVQRGIEALDNHFNGKEVQKFYDLTKESILPGTPYVELDNIKDFEAKGLPEY